MVDFNNINHGRLEGALSKLFTSVHGVKVEVKLTKKDCQENGNPNGIENCNNQYQTKE